MGGVGQDFNWIANYPYDPGFGALRSTKQLNWSSARDFQAPVVSIDPSVKGKSYKLLETKQVKQGQSHQEVLLSGVNSWVLAQDVDRYFSYNPRLVKVTQPATIHKTVDGGKIVSHVKPGQFVPIKSMTTTKHRTPRLEVAGGFLTASRTYAGLYGYYVSAPTKIKALRTMKLYQEKILIVPRPA